ncbi:MAG TPA: right-handed parallel beta-helix repeat-containing protein [Gemmatimonadota bacterium]|nr:right-handed parallel beta-helix repeat-containing protein [Gemmatimonadota bacterium]
MAYTLRGRIESRVAVALAPLLAGCILALVLQAWWPVELAGLMLGVGILFDVVYHRLVPYQPGWAALPLGVLELGVIMGFARLLDVGAPLSAALAFFAGSWLLAQALGHAIFPLARLSYGEDGGELGRAGPGLAAAALVVGVAAVGVAWATQPPVVHLAAGVHRGPLVLDYSQQLVGEPGAVVRGGIIVRADDVTIRDVTVVGGEHGIQIESAERVLLERVRVLDARLDGINVRRGQVTIRDCSVSMLGREYGQGIDISFTADFAPSLVESCVLTGGQEGIFLDSVHAMARDNHVRRTTLRGITVTEMAMVAVEGNTVEDALGIGILCSDYSMCDIRENSITRVHADEESSDSMREGYGIVSHYWAHVQAEDNDVSRSPHKMGAFSDAYITYE